METIKDAPIGRAFAGLLQVSEKRRAIRIQVYGEEVCRKGRFSDMKRVRQYIGILAAAAAYYLVHEGAHLLCAVLLGVFKQIRFMGIGMQIDEIGRAHV